MQRSPHRVMPSFINPLPRVTRARPATPRARRLAVVASFFCALLLAGASPHAHARERLRLDADWKFLLNDWRNAIAPPTAADFDDADWRTVRLPHDWSIEHAPTADAPSRGAGGYFRTGVGWYRRTIDAPASWRGQRITLQFEGVYHRCEVWLNGQSLGRHAYGYTPFQFDLTPHLKLGEPNILAVRVDNSEQRNCRWYSGSGIYRHVWLELTDPLHIDSGDHTIQTVAINDANAELRVRTFLVNESDTDRDATLELEIYDPDGESLLRLPNAGRIAAGARIGGNAGITVRNVRPWSPETPALYRLIARVKVDGRTIDQVATPFGIRTVKVSAERGFELNGQSVELFGACVHHDHGPLGAASFDRAEARKVELLKAAGFNAVRTSHNPPAPAFLTACDRLGLLVIDEAFDGWAKKKSDHDYHQDFADNWQADVEAMVRRDRNHPSVVMWSIGNEVYERGEESGARIAADLRAAVLALDSTRPITAASNGVGSDDRWPQLDPLFASLDVAGYNYELDRIESDHERLPDRAIVVTESFQNEAFAVWDLADRLPYMLGDFVWTGIDYLGEAAIGRVWAPGEQVRQHWEAEHFPWHGAYCGDIDLTGYRKPISHYRNIIWDRGEKLYAVVRVPAPGGGAWQPSMWAVMPELPSWTWPGQEGKELEVVAYSRHDEVQLFLNDKLIAQAETGREQKFQATFRVPYEPGELRVAGVDLTEAQPDGGRIEAEKITLTTAGDAAQIRLTPDRTQLTADGQDLAFVTVEVTDADGHWRPDVAVPVEYKLTGPGEIVGIAGGNLDSVESYQANPRKTHEGRALVVIRTTDTAGEITLTSSSPNLTSTPITLTTIAREP
jgi:beta-galactosidase